MMARPKGKPRARKDIRQAVKMYIDGVKMTEIATKFGVTQPTISYWVKRHGKSISGERYLKARRKQGRRQDEAPNERDKEIILKIMLGVPAAHIADQNGLSRARASFIVKTWTNRSYKPPMPFKVGDVVKDYQDSPSRFLIQEVRDYKRGCVLQIVGLISEENGFGRLEPARKIDNFRWYAGGCLCEVVNDTAKS